MTHLGERVTDFVFGELSTEEMSEAKRHLAECADCRTEVRQVEQTYARLRTSVDVEPPRHLVFETEKRSVAWRWFAPIGLAAALILGVLLAAPPAVQWGGSQLSISFGRGHSSAPVAAVIAPPAAVTQPVQPASSVDYDRVVQEVQKSQHDWFLTELKKRDAEHADEIQRIRGQFDYVKAQMEAIDRQNIGNSNGIQILAKRTADLSDHGQGGQE